jgi:hypothetical protein
LLRRQFLDPDDQAAVIAQTVDDASDDISAGAIVVITDIRIRLRLLPMSR